MSEKDLDLWLITLTSGVACGLIIGMATWLYPLIDGALITLLGPFLMFSNIYLAVKIHRLEKQEEQNG